jgi:hypothetical protein
MAVVALGRDGLGGRGDVIDPFLPEFHGNFDLLNLGIFRRPDHAVARLAVAWESSA